MQNKVVASLIPNSSYRYNYATYIGDEKFPKGIIEYGKLLYGKDANIEIFTEDDFGEFNVLKSKLEEYKTTDEYKKDFANHVETEQLYVSLPVVDTLRADIAPTSLMIYPKNRKFFVNIRQVKKDSLTPITESALYVPDEFGKSSMLTFILNGTATSLNKSTDTVRDDHDSYSIFGHGFYAPGLAQVQFHEDTTFVCVRFFGIDTIDSYIKKIGKGSYFIDAMFNTYVMFFSDSFVDSHNDAFSKHKFYKLDDDIVIKNTSDYESTFLVIHTLGEENAL